MNIWGKYIATFKISMKLFRIKVVLVLLQGVRRQIIVTICTHGKELEIK